MLLRLTIVCAVLLAGCASSSDIPAPAEAPEAAQATSEKLLVRPPDDWQLAYQFNNDKVRLVEFVSPEETRLEWTTKVTFESHAHLAGADPIDIMMAEVVRLQEPCDFVQHFNVFSGFENNYPTSARLMMCGFHEHLEQGQIELIKVIQGSDYLYVVRITRKLPQFKVNEPDIDDREIASWSDYLKRISLCDPATEDHPCPTGR